MKRPLPVSAIILTLNEEASIGSCLESIAGWIDDIHVVDSGSTDSTVEIARHSGASVTRHPFNGYSTQRNWAQDNLPLAHDWVLHIDADERVTAELRAGLVEAFDQAPAVRGILVRRRVRFLGRDILHGGIYPTHHCRVFDRRYGRCENRPYDQHFTVDGPTRVIEADLVEDTASDLFSWTARHNQWAQLEAQWLASRSVGDLPDPTPRSLAPTIRHRRKLKESYYRRRPLLRAWLYFVYRYILRGGFRDGVEGLIYHTLQGFWFRFYIDSCVHEIRRRDLDRAGTP